MFCPQCGTDNLTNLKFCTRCGTNLDVLSRAMTSPPPVTATQSLITRDHVKALLWTIALVTVLGLGTLTGLLVALAATLRNDDLVGILGMFGFASITTIVVFLVRLLGRKIEAPVGEHTAAASEKQVFANPAYLPPSSMGSVVESTTSRLPAEERRTKG